MLFNLVVPGYLKNVFKTSFVRYGCLKDVSETACAHCVLLTDSRVKCKNYELNKQEEQIKIFSLTQKCFELITFDAISIIFIHNVYYFYL